MLKAKNGAIIAALNENTGSAVYSAFTQADLADINSVYDNIMQNRTLRNDFVNSLVTQIGFISVNKMLFENELAELKKAPMRYGQTEQEIFVNMIESSDYNFFADEKEIFQLYKSNIMTAFHDVNFRKKWSVTISYDELRNAFRDEYGLQSLINAKLDVLYSSASYKEYLVTKNLLTQGYEHGCIYPIEVPEPSTESNIKEMLIAIRSTIDTLRFPNPKFNYAGSDATSRPEDLVFVTTPDINARIDVNALAYAFNMSKAEVSTRTIIVDSLPTNVYGFITDVRFFNIREQHREFAENYRGDNLRWNFFYHLWEMFSISPFRPCVVFTSNPIAGDEITISGPDSITRDSQTVYKAEISDSKSTQGAVIPQAADWEIVGTVTGNTTGFVSGSGILNVDKNETASSITIKATSRYNPSVSITKQITVTM